MRQKGKTSHLASEKSHSSYLRRILPSVLGGALSWGLLLWLVAWLLS
jgi:hypothetical protein